MKKLLLILSILYAPNSLKYAPGPESGGADNIFPEEASFIIPPISYLIKKCSICSFVTFILLA